MSEFPASSSDEIRTTKFLNVPILSDEQRAALHSLPDRGITPVEGLRRFPTFEAWMQAGGMRHRNNFWLRFTSGIHGDWYRETQWSQRFSELFPEEEAHLTELVDSYYIRPEDASKSIADEHERTFWQAHEQLADLVDARDAMLDAGQGIQPGGIDPFLLTR